MKKVEAIIQPFKVDDVKEALKSLGVDGMTLSEVRGHGHQKGKTETYRGQEYNIDLLPKIRLEMVVQNAMVDKIVEAVTTAARSGKIGDGKIFISSIEDVVRIRNGDRGEGAL